MDFTVDRIHYSSRYRHYVREEYERTTFTKIAD